ncbi:amiloride-sensitive sodium channel subunit alpha [Strongylocentrotus purpuratus]|uniref:Uncharacterized protein n=1 Tax=Strongylocentrotus purpuratus TaxID=7668 RepID=A0A7M7SUT4_STRPU|nr:amiloride-sensitive sodium channel subunit alpha [Strongylocentrotus purpuratus]XP_030832763.1 amiloride-sensitive sodium channel subunit alpha [Strongylocentrotus purpuratus]
MDTEEKDTVKKSVTDFGNETTIHGLQFVVNKKNIIYRLCWLGICTTFLVVFLIQGNVILKDFLRWPYSTKIDIVGRPNLAFPAVTVCNANMMRRSQIEGSRFEDLVNLDGGVEGADYDYSWWFSSAYRNWYASSSASSYGQSSDQNSNGRSSSSSQSDSASSSDGQSSSSNYDPSSSEESSSASSGESSGVTSDGQSSSSSYSPSSSEESSSASSGESSGGTSDGQSSSSNDGPSSSEEPASSSPGGSADGQSSSTNYGPPPSGSVSSFGLPNSEFPAPNWVNEWSWYDPSFFADFEFSENGWDGVSGGEDWQGFYEASKADDYSDFLNVINPTKEELEQYGHQLEDFIVQCTFDRRPCNISRDFHVWQNRHYGNCFTFNTELSPDNKNILTGKTGGLNGLHLTLFVEQPEYLGVLSHQTGAKVTIHHPNEYPFPEDNALSLGTGQETSIGIRQEYIKRLGGYYTNCTSDGKDTNFTSTTELSYSSVACKKICYQLHLSQLCKCVDDQFYDGFPTKCDVLNMTHQICRKFVEDLFLDDKLPCSCPPPCTEFKYVRTPSSSLWPSERYEEHLLRRLNGSANENLIRVLQSNELSRKNLIRLKIFYEDLNYEVVEMVPVYTIPSVLGSIGGLMGLYIGMSFISVFEVLFLVLRLIKIALIRIYSRINRVQPYPVKNV